MDDSILRDLPEMHSRITEKCDEIGFTMPSDLYIGTLLKTLITSKPGGKFLELGTGIGLSLSWMVEGMDKDSRIISIDNDSQLIEIAKENFGHDARIDLLLADGKAWLCDYKGEGFDLIFADAWPGKYGELDETLNLLKIGGFYVVDDMSYQPNWPDGHEDKAEALLEDLESRPNLSLTKMNWSTGIIIAVRKC